MRGFDRIIGYDEEKEALMQVSDMAKNPGKYLDLGVSLPRGFMLYGEPGVGKTLMFEALIEEMGRPAFTVRKSKASRDFISEIGKAFEDARGAAPSVVFLDDLDKFSSDENSGSPEEFVAVQAGIDSVKEADVLVLATANSIRRLPKSLFRSGRFDHVMEIEPPTYRDSVKIIGHYLEGKKVAGDVTPESIARVMAGKSCATLASVLNEAGILAAFEGRSEIGRKHFVRSALREIFESGGGSMSGVCDETRAEIGFHEAGHAAVALLYDPESVSLVSLHSKNGRGDGITQFVTADGFYNSERLMRERIVALLAGVGAVRIKFAHTDVGASSDLAKAADLAERFVASFGAGGFRYLTGGRGSVESAALCDGIASERNAMVARSYDEAVRILTDNWDLVEAIEAALMEKETLLYDDIREIYAEMRPAA